MKIYLSKMSSLVGILFGALALLPSCSNEADTPIDSQPVSRSVAGLTTVSPDTSKVILPTKAMAIAAQLGAADPKSRAASRVAESVEAITDEEGTPLMYVVNYTNEQGYVILSASTSYTPILAQSDEGRFDIANLDAEHPVNLWLDEQKYIVSHVDVLPDSIRSQAASEWMAYNFDRAEVAPLSANADKPQVYYDSLRRWTLDPNIEVYTYEDYIQTSEYQNLSEIEKQEISQGIWAAGNSNYGSIESSTLVLRSYKYTEWQRYLMTSTWDQENDYNKFFPIKSSSGNPNAAGCGNVALGQVMYYHRYPSTFNWNGMRDNYATDVTAQFLYDLSIATKSKYNSDRSTGTTVDNVKSVLEKNGYTVTKSSHSTDVGYSQRIIASVQNNKPVIMKGKRKDDGETIGHMWVCDGARESYNSYTLRFMTIEYRPTTTSEPNLMVEGACRNWVGSYATPTLHMNWGYNGKYNGYFFDTNISFNNSNGELRDYKYNREDLYISPGK